MSKRINYTREEREAIESAYRDAYRACDHWDHSSKHNWESVYRMARSDADSKTEAQARCIHAVLDGYTKPSAPIHGFSGIVDWYLFGYIIGTKWVTRYRTHRCNDRSTAQRHGRKREATLRAMRAAWDTHMRAQDRWLESIR